MQSVLQLLIKYGATILFVLLEIVCLFLIVNYNQTQKSIFLNSSKVYGTSISEQVQSYKSFIDLKTVNDSLSKIQANEMGLLFNKPKQLEVDSSLFTRYEVKPAFVVKNSSHLRNNTLTLNIGSDEGIKPSMGVISRSGLVGTVTNVSKNYCQVNSVLHSQSRISCTVDPYLYPGNLVWYGNNPRKATLEAIPEHLELHEGDTISTNGFSTIFPRGIKVGTIASFEKKKGTGNYNIEVNLNNEIAGEKVVYVIIDKDAKEIQQLESSYE